MAMSDHNVLSFRERQIQTSDGQRRFLDFVIDGASLPDQIGKTKSQVTPFGGWRVELLDDYMASLIGRGASEMPSGRVPLYVCEMCGGLDCGAVVARISIAGDTVIW